MTMSQVAMGTDCFQCVRRRSAARFVSSSFRPLDNAEFQLRLRTLKAFWDEDKASAQFEDLCERFDHDYPTFIAELRKGRHTSVTIS